MLGRRLTRLEVDHLWTSRRPLRWKSSSVSAAQIASPPPLIADRPHKIAVLPFRFSASSARNLAKDIARTEYVMTHLDGSANILVFIFKKLLSFIGFSTQESELEKKTKLLNLRAVYLPYWSIDAAGLMNSHTEIESATARVIFRDERLPAHDESALRTLPFKVPSPKDVEYAVFNTKKHLSSKPVGKKPEVLPFVISPFLLPSMVIGAEFLKSPFPIVETKDVVGKESAEEAVEAISKGVSTGNAKETLQFKSESIQVDYLTCSPVLLPFYLAKFTNTSQSVSDEGRELTIALPDWPIKRAPWAIFTESTKEKGKTIPSSLDWKLPLIPRLSFGSKFYSQLEQPPPSILFTLFFNPRTPIPSHIEQQKILLQKEGDEKEEEEMKRCNIELDAAEKVFNNHVERKNLYKKHRKILKEIREVSNKKCLTLAENERRREGVAAFSIVYWMVLKVETLFKNSAAWGTLQRLTRLEFERCVEKEEDFSTSTPESKAGLGRFIPWNEEQITHFGGDQYKANKEYTNQLYDYQKIKSTIFAEERILDEEQFWQDEKGKTAKDSLITLKDGLISKAPFWLLNYVRKEKARLNRVVEKMAKERAAVKMEAEQYRKGNIQQNTKGGELRKPKEKKQAVGGKT